jgi:hypothetical protein
VVRARGCVAVTIAIEEGVGGIIAFNTTVSREGLRTPADAVHSLGPGDGASSIVAARAMGRLGKPQGVEPGPGPRMRRREGSRRGLKIGATLFAIVLLLGLLAGGGYVLLSRSFFVGELDGELAIYNGIPQSVGGLPLHWVRESDTGVPTDDLPPFRAERVREGIPAESLVHAREIVENHRQLIDEETEPEPAPPEDEAPDDADLVEARTS